MMEHQGQIYDSIMNIPYSRRVRLYEKKVNIEKGRAKSGATGLGTSSKPRRRR